MKHECPAKKGDIRCVRPRGHDGKHYGTNWVDGTCTWDEDVPEEPPTEVVKASSKPPPKPKPKGKKKTAKPTRYCPDCGKERPVEEFYKCGRRYQRLCKFHDNRRRTRIEAPLPGREACLACYDMSWRRPKDKPCPGCGKTYAEEKVERVPRGSTGNWGDW